MTPFTPTHYWRLGLGSHGDDHMVVQIIDPAERWPGTSFSVARTETGNRYAVMRSELTPIDQVRAS